MKVIICLLVLFGVITWLGEPIEADLSAAKAPINACHENVPTLAHVRLQPMPDESNGQIALTNTPPVYQCNCSDGVGQTAKYNFPDTSSNTGDLQSVVINCLQPFQFCVRGRQPGMKELHYYAVTQFTPGQFATINTNLYAYCPKPDECHMYLVVAALTAKAVTFTSLDKAHSFSCAKDQNGTCNGHPPLNDKNENYIRVWAAGCEGCDALKSNYEHKDQCTEIDDPPNAEY